MGVETEFNANGGNGDAPYLVRGEIVNNPDFWRGEVDLKWSGSTRLRMGYAMDRWMPFVTGGVAYGAYDFKTRYVSDVYDEGDGTLVGWTIGGGAEYAVTDNIRVRGSYLFTDFGSHSFDAEYGPAWGDGYSDSYDIDLKTHAVTLGLSYNW